MGWYFTNNDTGFGRTSNLPNLNGTYTITFGLLLLGYNPSNQSLPYFLSDGPFANYDTLKISTSGVLGLEVSLSAATTNIAGSTLALNKWHSVAVVRESPTSIKLYVNNILDITNTTNMGTGRTAASMLDVSRIISASADRWTNGIFSNIKIWDRALTAAEIAVETLSPIVYNPSKINGWYPTPTGSTERLRDFSGNGNNWTLSGSSLIDSVNAPVQSFMQQRYVPFEIIAAGGVGLPFFMQNDLLTGNLQQLSGGFQ